MLTRLDATVESVRLTAVYRSGLGVHVTNMSPAGMVPPEKSFRTATPLAWSTSGVASFGGAVSTGAGGGATGAGGGAEWHAARITRTAQATTRGTSSLPEVAPSSGTRLHCDWLATVTYATHRPRPSLHDLRWHERVLGRSVPQLAIGVPSPAFI